MYDQFCLDMNIGLDMFAGHSLYLEIFYINHLLINKCDTYIIYMYTLTHMLFQTLERQPSHGFQSVHDS